MLRTRLTHALLVTAATAALTVAPAATGVAAPASASSASPASPASPAAPGSPVALAAGPGTNYAVDDPFVSSRTAWWRSSRFGMFIHFGDYAQWEGVYTKPDGTVCRNAEWILNRCGIPMAEYEAKAWQFNPSRWDGNAVAKLAKDAGQRYIVITSKHHDGYAMWPTKVNTWNLRDHSAFPKTRDLLAELKQGADAQGVKLGFYYSILDWHNPNFTSNFAQYKKDMYAQLKELVTGYHPALLWFDGQWPSQWTVRDAEDLQAYLHGLDPNLILDNRVGKKRVVDGDFGTPEQTIPTEPVDGQLWESCMTTNGHWGYASYDTNWKSPTTLTRNLLDIAGRSGNYLLNIGPKPDGTVPSQAATNLRGVGSWLASDGQGSAVYGARAPGLVADPSWGAVSRASNKLYLSVYSWPGAGQPVHLTARAPFSITAARVLGSSQQVTWRAAGDGFDVIPAGSATSSLATVIELTFSTQAPSTGTGTGLTGQYWTNTSWSGTPAVTRTDPTLNFAWRYQGSPAASVPTDSFSARWTGSVQAPYTGTWTFETVSDDTVKVWVDGKVVIDNSTPHAATVNKGTVSLTAGRRYAIRVDYTERTGEAYLKLLWSSPHQGQRIIPASQLYPAS